MIITVNLLKLNEKTDFGNLFTDEDAKLILNKFMLRFPVYGELDPQDNYLDVSLHNVSHTIDKIWIENNFIWGNIKVINTSNGKVLKELIGDENLFEGLKAKNRDLKIDSILDDEDKDYKYIYPSDILKEKGLYISLRGTTLYGRLNNFFTFDIRTYDRETLFIEK